MNNLPNTITKNIEKAKNHIKLNYNPKKLSDEQYQDIADYFNTPYWWIIKRELQHN